MYIVGASQAEVLSILIGFIMPFKEEHIALHLLVGRPKVCSEERALASSTKGLWECSRAPALLNRLRTLSAQHLENGISCMGWLRVKENPQLIFSRRVKLLKTGRHCILRTLCLTDIKLCTSLRSRCPILILWSRVKVDMNILAAQYLENP